MRRKRRIEKIFSLYPMQILVWHVKSTYKSLVYEKKHPSDPKVKV